ncbi:MAG: PilZ domain-containing protein [Fibrobacteraceae bacterium]|nr:PilZ domain-containing protein [Fibrobacteraceae bacterium]
MIEPGQLLWLGSIAIMLLVLVVLLEVHRINYRRENEEMFGSAEFDEKIQSFQFTPKETRTLEKLVRASHYENKDAVINSSSLFEAAVTNFYDFRNVFTVRDETLHAVEVLREKMNFTASNPLTIISSTRQWNIGNRIDFFLGGGKTMKHSEITRRDEKEWCISYDGSCGPHSQFLGKQIHVRWTRPDDAVYSAELQVRSYTNKELVLEHSSKLEKKQLRRWVREVVDFPVEASFSDGTVQKGLLYDLSAGGISIGLPVEVDGGTKISIRFTLPSFGEENVEIEILRCLGHKNPKYPDYFTLTASFVGTFGWTQERVLQYIFEANKKKKWGKMT